MAAVTANEFLVGSNISNSIRTHNLGSISRPLENRILEDLIDVGLAIIPNIIDHGGILPLPFDDLVSEEFRMNRNVHICPFHVSEECNVHSTPLSE